MKTSTCALSAALAIAIAGPAAAATCSIAPGASEKWPQPTVVHFDTGKTAIKADDAAKIVRLASEAKGQYVQQVCVTGFADKQGNAQSNQKLSAQRAKAVADELRKNGVDPKTIVIQAAGEPGAQIGGSVVAKNQADRRVEIRFTR
jgi:outer membrane protein OmpA-like peptidoglycan-associated protein